MGLGRYRVVTHRQTDTWADGRTDIITIAVKLLICTYSAMRLSIFVVVKVVKSLVVIEALVALAICSLHKSEEPK